MRTCCILAVQAGHLMATYTDDGGRVSERELRAGDVVGEVVFT